MIGLATCTLGTIRIEHETAMMNHIYPMGRKFQRMVITGKNVLDARNTALFIAEKEGYDFLFFWDDDIIPQTPAALGLLCAALEGQAHVDLVGGVYPRRGLMCDPIVVKAPDEGIWWGWKDAGPYTIHKVYMTGTGFLGIRIPSLQKLNVETYTVDGCDIRRYFDNTPSARTDDFDLADKCLEAGLEWYVAGGAVCDQIDLDGKRYRIEDAEIKVAV